MSLKDVCLGQKRVSFCGVDSTVLERVRCVLWVLFNVYTIVKQMRVRVVVKCV